MILPPYVEKVINPYSVSDSSLRIGLMINGPWVTDIEEYIKTNNIKALYFNSSKGWIGEDFSFLRNLNSIEELNIINSNSTGLESIGYLNSLVELHITTSSKSIVDFSNLKRLKNCSVYWWRGFANVLEVRSLRKFSVEAFDPYDLESLAKMSWLDTLAIDCSKINSLEFLRGMKNLSKLQLGGCKKINSFDTLSMLSLIKWLSIERVSRIGAISFVRSMVNLEVFILDSVGEVTTLGDLRDAVRLKAFAFPGNTIIKDGNLTVLTELPDLAMLMFAPRRHYSHCLIKSWDWNNFESPDTLLARKRANIA